VPKALLPETTFTQRIEDKVNIRPHLSFLAKWTICGIALWWVARGVAVDELLSSWLNANPLLLIGAIGIFLLTPVLQGVRLKRLLDAQGSPISAAESIRLAFAGNFMNFAVPIGSTTGDVYKAAYLGRRSDRPWEVTVTTFIDRGIGLATLLLSVALIVLASGPNSPLAPMKAYLALLSLGLIAGVGAIRWFPLQTLDHPRLAWVPARDKIVRVATAARGSVASPKILTLAILDTLGIQIAATASFLCVTLALGFQMGSHDWFNLYAFFSTGEIVKALPGPPQGLGTLEAAYGIFFQQWATPSQIVNAAVAIRAINLICSLPGAALAIGSARVFAPFDRPSTLVTGR